MFSRNSSPYSSARGRTSVSRQKAISKVPRQAAAPKVLTQNASPKVPQNASPRMPLNASPRVPLKAISKQAVNRRLILEEPNTSQAISQQERIVTEEEQIPPGSAYQRREFVFEEDSMQVEEDPELPSSLFDCVANGELRMELAAKLMLHRTKTGTFNYAAYDEFVSSNVAARAVSRYDGLDGFEDPHIVGCNFMAMRLLADIGKAQMMKIARQNELAEKTDESVMRRAQLCLRNCRKKWFICANPPFVKLDIMSCVMSKWSPRRKDNTTQSLTSLYRFLLQQITSPPQQIQEYSLRLNGRNGRDAKLQNLPDEIETTLIDFADDMLGYGYDELEPGAIVDFENSAFYASLGTEETERRQNFDQASREKMRWRPQLFKALQFALRDIRSYTYKESKWIPNKRQSKKVVEELVDDGAVTGDDDDLFIADE